MRKMLVFFLTGLVLLSGAAQPGFASRKDFKDTVNILFLKGDYSAVIREVDKNLKRERLARKDKKEVMYLAGLSYVKLQDFAAARGIFSDIIEMNGREYEEDAHISIGDSYFYEGNADRAIAAYEKVIELYPRSDRLSGVYSNLGTCYNAKKDTYRANKYFEKVKKGYSGSFESEETKYVPTGQAPTYYIIQLGAFDSFENAKKMRRKLSRKKFESYIQKIKRDGHVLYRVRAGKFSNKYYAERLVKKLRKSGFQAKIIEE